VKVLITGAGGQVGRALVRTAPSDYIVDSLTHSQLDLGNRDQVAACIADAKPNVVINAAAYTAVDRAESDREHAFAVNSVGVGVLAQACHAANARLIHISTDYVFDGCSTVPYESSTPTNPINAYGASKLAGEHAIAETPALEWVIVRTSWVYAPWGQNFLLTMLRLMRERGSVSVVSDQIGAPTSALGLAGFLWRIASLPKVRGLLHYADSGVASWYDFAVAINEEATAIGLLQHPAIVKPIRTSEYPTPAKRPALSLLSTQSSLATASFTPTHWREALRTIVKELKT
jgi:dTDP-4-dehydrorhamnose reductase